MKIQTKKTLLKDRKNVAQATKLAWPRCSGPLLELLSGGLPDPSTMLLPIFSQPDMNAAVLPSLVTYLLWNPSDANEILSSEDHKARLAKVVTLGDGLNFFSEVLQPDEIAQLFSRLTHLKSHLSSPGRCGSATSIDALTIRSQPLNV